MRQLHVLLSVDKIICVQGSIYSLFLYDAVYLYMTMVDQIVSEGLDWRNGTFWRIMARNWVTYGQLICRSLLSFNAVYYFINVHVLYTRGHLTLSWTCGPR